MSPSKELSFAHQDRATDFEDLQDIWHYASSANDYEWYSVECKDGAYYYTEEDFSEDSFQARGLSSSDICANSYVVPKDTTVKDVQRLIRLCLDNEPSCPGDRLSCWDTSEVTNMNYWFLTRNIPLSHISELKKWNTGRVTSMAGLFSHASLDQLDLSEWDFGKVTSMSHMFEYSIGTVEGIDDWDVSNVFQMNHMFLGAKNIPSGLWKWDVKNVVTMKGMFWSAETSGKLHLQAWDFHDSVDMSNMMKKFKGVGYDENALTRDEKRRLCPYWLTLDNPPFSDCNDCDQTVTASSNSELKTIMGNQLSMHGWDDAPIGCIKLAEDFRDVSIPYAHPGIWNWDVSNVETISFGMGITFQDPLYLKNWKSAPLRDTNRTFADVDFGSFFDSVNINELSLYHGSDNNNNPDRIDMVKMFAGATTNTPVDFKDFKGHVDGWTERQIHNLRPYIKFVRDAEKETCELS